MTPNHPSTLLVVTGLDRGTCAWTCARTASMSGFAIFLRFRAPPTMGLGRFLFGLTTLNLWERRWSPQPFCLHEGLTLEYVWYRGSISARTGSVINEHSAFEGSVRCSRSVLISVTTGQRNYQVTLMEWLRVYNKIFLWDHRTGPLWCDYSRYNPLHQRTSDLWEDITTLSL